MPFKDLLKEKNKRLNDVPLALQTKVQKQQKKVISKTLKEINTLTTNSSGEIIINSANSDLLVYSNQ